MSVKIGTPLTSGATRVLLLGSGELGKEVAIALQRYGVEVIAADRYAHAPAHQVAHSAHVLDMTNPAELEKLIEVVRPHLIVPEIEAIATDVLIEIERNGVATVVPTARAVSLTMNREGIRRLASEQLGLPTSPYEFADNFESFEAAVKRIGFPCFSKPVMSSSGKGQSMLKSVDDIPSAWQYAQQGGRVKANKVIVEGFIDFDFEITLLTVRASDKESGVVTHFCEPIGHRQEKGDYVESWQPQGMSEKARSEAERIARAVTDELGGRGVFGVELFVKGDSVWFSEVSPRPHDTGMVTMVTQVQNEFELHARAILGLPVQTSLGSPGASAVIYAGRDADGICFEGVDDALAIADSEIRLFGKPTASVRRRMGVALARGPLTEVARSRAQEVALRVRTKTEQD